MILYYQQDRTKLKFKLIFLSVRHKSITFFHVKYVMVNKLNTLNMKDFFLNQNHLTLTESSM